MENLPRNLKILPWNAGIPPRIGKMLPQITEMLPQGLSYLRESVGVGGAGRRGTEPNATGTTASEAESTADFLVVVEMVLDALDILVGFVPLPGHKYDIAGLRHHGCAADGLAAVHDADGLLHFLRR